MADRSTRRPLHQRSDSDTNSKSLTSGPSSTTSGVSQKNHDVSSWLPSRSSTTSTKNSKRHKSQKSQASIHSSTTGTSRSGTVRSVVSLDSLPPVPPLRITKSFRNSTLSVFQDLDPATRDYEALGSGGEASNSGPQRPQTPPSAVAATAPQLPRSILKKPSKTALPPCTESDYRFKSRSWVGSDALDLTPNRARMNAQTLRLVNNVGTDLPASLDLEVEGSNRIGESSTAPYASHSRSPSDLVTPPSAARPFTPSHPSNYAKQFPAWARYFYGRRGGRTSVIEPAVASTPSDSLPIGIAITSSEERPRTAGSTLSISSIPRRLAMRRRDPETTTLWSLPHLDHTPLFRLENVDRQLILFCLGFLMPLFWWIAAFLPLPAGGFPADGQSGDVEAWGAHATTSKEIRKVEMAHKRRYKNARWWRQINRVLSVVGILVVSAIIALAVVGARIS